MTSINATKSIEEKYERYMDSIKKASKKYITNHRDEINAKCRNYYHKKLANNETYKAKKKEYNRMLYQKKKAEKLSNKISV